MRNRDASGPGKNAFGSRYSLQIYRLERPGGGALSELLRTSQPSIRAFCNEGRQIHERYIIVHV